MDYQEIKRRIKKEAQLIKVETTLGTAVRVSKKDAIRLIDMLESRRVEPKVDFTELYNKRYLVIISSQ